MASVQQIIGKINPLLYAENGKELLKKYGSVNEIPANEVRPKNLGEHLLGYDSPTETLEPVYFFILDLMNEFGLNAEKLVDNFSSTPGSGHFSELMGKATAMQQQASKMLADIGIVMRGVLNTVYDLKDFKIRLQSYDNLHSKNQETSNAARHSLKQIWMDKVDIIKGNSSISMMARQLGFETIFDAFLVAKDAKDADKIDLNDRVKRIIKSRVEEFNIWVEESQKELRKRYRLQRIYLKSQVNNLKLYSRWAKPYLKAAQQLEMKEFGREEPALVKAFNTILFELTLFGKSKINVKNEALGGEFPKEFQKLKTKRDYFSCILIDFKFRGIPQRVAQRGDYVSGGKAEITFSAYALNSDEIEMLNKELDKEDIGDVLKLIEGTTTESLGELQDEINFFLEEKDKSEEKKEGSNPFLALVGHYNENSEKKEGGKKETKNKEKKISPDNWIEKTHIRKLAITKSKETTFLLFDIYKKAHGMVSYN